MKYKLRRRLSQESARKKKRRGRKKGLHLTRGPSDSHSQTERVPNTRIVIEKKLLKVLTD